MSATEAIYHSYSNLNASMIFREKVARRMHIFTIVIYSLMFLLGVTGNGLVILVTGFRMKKTVNTVWFLSLAIADFTFTFSLLLNITIGVIENWPFGQTMCKFINTLTHLNLNASIYHLMVISLDRYISTLWPVWAQNHRTPWRASIVACGVWILALLLCLPYYHFSKTISTPDGKLVCYCVEGITQEQNITHSAETISRFILTFAIPFGIIVVCYGAVVLKLRRNRLSQSNKPFRVITAVTVAFFVCWFPYHIFSFIGLKATENGDLKLVLTIGLPLAYILGYLNSCLNPILYAFMGYDFKQKLRLLSAFENAFAEDSAQNRGSTNIKSSASLELQ